MGAKRDMQRGPLFRLVDVRSGAHRLTGVIHPGCLSSDYQLRKRLIIDELFAQVDADAGNFMAQAIEPVRFSRK